MLAEISAPLTLRADACCWDWVYQQQVQLFREAGPRDAQVSGQNRSAALSLTVAGAGVGFNLHDGWRGHFEIGDEETELDMLGPKPLDDAYVRKHARPGETWDEARNRLEGEVYQRYTELPGCVECAQQANGVEHAEYLHRFGQCLGNKWPEAALSAELFNAAKAQHLHRKRDLAAIARGNIRAMLAHIDAQMYPINALMQAVKVVGYLQSCRHLDLFENSEQCDFDLAAFAAEERARKAFKQQYEQHDPEALPWR